jgi:hypothetical protein
MGMQKAQEVVVDKEIINHIVSDIEHLIDDIEMIVDRGSMKKIDKRLKDVRGGRVKGFSERDFDKFMSKMV